MKRSRTLKAVSYLVVVSAVLLAACQQAAPQAAATTSTLDNIRAAGVMRACIAPEFPPDMYLDEQGNPDGFSVALTEKMAESLGVTVEWVTSDFAGIIAGVGSGKCDIAPGTVAPRAQRALVGSFAKVILLSVVGLSVKADDTRTTIEEFNQPDVTFAVLEGTLSESVYNRFFPNAQATMFSDVNAGFLEVLSGRADAYPMDDVTGIAYANQQPDLKMILIGSGGLGVSPTAPLVPLNDHNFIRWIDTFVDEFINNGDYAVLFEEEMGYQPDIPTLMAWR
jgi:polar amino acid transport system substrate-binding protein